MIDLGKMEHDAREAQERAEKATPGPWTVEEEYRDGLRWSIGMGSVEISAPDLEDPSPDTALMVGRLKEPYDRRKFRVLEDASFIAAARTDVPALSSHILALCAEVRRLQEVRSELILESEATAQERDEARAALGRVLRLDTPWPLADVLKRLADAADHLLTDHSCDAHGHEGIMAARDAARDIMALLRAAEGRGE